MDSQQIIELYERIQAFSFDQPNTKLSFTQRLARDNGWSLGYAKRVIDEYKKFTFLAIVAEHPVTPSDQVDQVWHLHLTYTRSYWQEFCPKVLQSSLHHEPSRGGRSEKLKFEDWYSWTLQSYQGFFGNLPPDDIWPHPKDRFESNQCFVRINTQQNWLVPKPSLGFLLKPPCNQPVILLLLFILGIFTTSCQIIPGIPNPLDFTGPQFLAFYFFLSTIVIIWAISLQDHLRSPYNNPIEKPVSLDIYEIAYLANGKEHAIDTAIVSLIQKEYVTLQPKGGILSLNQKLEHSIHSEEYMTVEEDGQILLWSKPVEQFTHPLEQAVAMAILQYGNIDSVYHAVTDTINSMSDRLCQLSLLLTDTQSTKARFYPAILMTCLLGLGIAKIAVGISRDKPVGFLVVMCIVITTIALSLCLSQIRLTHYGDRVLRKFIIHNRLKIETEQDPRLPLAFAIVGSYVFSGNIFPELKPLMNPVVNYDSGYGSRSGRYGGGGGGGGGGCGGGDGGGGGGGGDGGGGCGGCGGGGG